MAIETSDFRELAKIITSETMKTVGAGKKTIIAPTVQRQMTSKIVEQAESGSEKRFLNAFKSAEKIIEKLGINVKEFNTGLGKRIEELKSQRDTSEIEVEKLRSDNIAAETRVIEKEGKQVIATSILTKKEIRDRQREIIMAEKILVREEKEAQKRKAELLKKETLTFDDNQRILADEENLVKIKQDIQEKQDSLGTGVDTGGQRDRSPSSSFLQELMMPFTAVGDALLSVRDIAYGVTDVFTFFTKGGLTKSLKKFASGVKAVARFFGSAKVLIGIAIAGVLLLMYKFRDKIGDVAAAIMKIPGKIFDFFKSVFTIIKDFFIDMINGVIRLINKVLGKFGVDIDLLKTSKDKEEDQKEVELKAKENREATALMKEGDVTQEEKDKLKELESPVNQKIIPDTSISLDDIQAGKKIEFASMNAEDRTKALAGSQEITSSGTANVQINNNTSQSNTSNSGSSMSTVYTDNKNTDPTLINLNGTAIA